jgi:hypothetical protein
MTWGAVAVLLGAGLAACNAVSDECGSYASCGEGAGGAAEAGAGDGGAPGTGPGQGASGKGGNNASGADGDAGAAGDGGDGGNGVEACDTTRSPREESCLVADDFAVFVAPDGNDENSGSQQAPLASLSRALEVAAGDKLVLVCSGTYDEHVEVTAGARIFGGFDCADFRQTAPNPVFSPTTAGPALSIDTVEDPVLIDGLSFEVADAEEPGETALAAIVHASLDVTLRSVSLTAGEGRAGANGKLNAFEFPEPATFKGNPENPATMGGAEKVCVCQRGLTSTGGVGGTASSSGQNGARGLPNHGGGAGGDPAPGDCGGGSSGKKGADAPAQAAAAGAETLGTAAASGWTPSPGADGAPGQPGQGGGGGASLNNSGHGGGGGCGGCGGNGATAGKGGGGSIALLVIESSVILEASSLVTADAGKGGAGAVGQAGQKEAGGGGAPVDTQNSCGGGSGGSGAAGGASGGGAGGISVGILWQGETPPGVSDDTSISTGKPGAKGAGGVPGSNDGIAGVAQEILQLE